jgi:cytochrome c oxidase subunit 2
MNLANFPMSPPQASNFAYEHDLIFYALTILTVFFTGLIMTLVVFFAVKYRAGNKVDRSRPMYENLKLELTWTFIPLIAGLIFFYFGASLFIKMRSAPDDAQEVFVIGKQWMWHIQHSNGIRENNTLHVPIGKPIKLTMISQDVIHAFYIPAFRTQMHVVPGRYTSMWFIPTKVGEYHLFCGMYCGTQHSEMGGKVVVMDQREWAEWAANGGEARKPMTMAQTGAHLFAKVGCNNCHGGIDTPRAPSLTKLFGKRQTMADGTTRIADEEYIRESILRPHVELTAGYEETMPIYQDQLSEADVLNLIAFIKGSGGNTIGINSSPISTRGIGLNSNAGGNNNSATVTESRDPMSVGAIRYESPVVETTPTNRSKNPAVGAIAAEGKQ